MRDPWELPLKIPANLCLTLQPICERRCKSPSDSVPCGHSDRPPSTTPCTSSAAKLAGWVQSPGSVKLHGSVEPPGSVRQVSSVHLLRSTLPDQRLHQEQPQRRDSVTPFASASPSGPAPQVQRPHCRPGTASEPDPAHSPVIPRGSLPLLPMASKPLHFLLLGLLGAAPLAVVPLVFAESEAPPLTLAPAAAPEAAPAPPAAVQQGNPAPLSASPSPPSPSSQLASPPMAEAPLRPSAEERRSVQPRRFDASLDELVRDGVISPSERIRVHGGLIGPMNTARLQACRSGALSALE